ncbi:hypothetical protein [Halovivax limisalsi]|uniref:hypothetical protein n=1 Tax=Halovivax limisalsi TaxID=1453760 RepID=UPI001FFDD4ED|nr:hypothetical protein [Halovivax limisalsi]
MNRWGFAAVGCLVLVTITTISVGGVAVVDSTSGDEGAPERSMGEELGTFMHQSTAEASGDVDRGMFEASFDRSEDKATAVTDRTGDLEATYESIRERMRALENDTALPERAREARLTRLAVELDSLNESIDDVERRATDVGVDTARLQRLRGNASDLTGPEVAAVARNLSGVNPPGIDGSGPPGQDGERGPPAEKPGNGGDGGPSEGDSGDDDTPPEEGDQGPPDDDDRGPPADDEADSDDGGDDSSTDSTG